LLSDDGSLWITIDDNEAHYLKVVCDEIFGRQNFVSNVVWEKKSASQANASWLSDSHDHVLVFAKNKNQLIFNKLSRTENQNSIYKYSDQYDGIDKNGNWYGRGPWYADNLTLSLASGQRGKQYAKTGESANIYPIVTPSGREVWPATGRAWSYTKDSLSKLLIDNRVWFGKSGDNKPTLKRFLSEVQDKGVVPTTNWHYSDVGENRVAAQEMKLLFQDDPFATPKPEKLLQRILHLSTNYGDLILDSFAGSGTTGAVAHKMGRRWIMVELGEHCHTHIIPRLQKVITGEDRGGISKAVNWQGGGGFRYYKLAPSLIINDRWGNPVVNPEYNAAMLAEALCKLEGFVYAPSESRWWQHGHSSERDFIYVTTQNLSAEQLQALADEVGGEFSLLLCCSAFHGITAAQANERWPNLTLKKIPKMVLARCEWGHDDYSLNVANLPMAELEPVPDNTKPARVKSRTSNPAQQSLFAEDEEA
jgi:adenine-specific DNA-methyltransferase